MEKKSKGGGRAFSRWVGLVKEWRREKEKEEMDKDAHHAWALSVGYYIWLDMIKCD